MKKIEKIAQIKEAEARFISRYTIRQLTKHLRQFRKKRGKPSLIEKFVTGVKKRPQLA